MSEQNTATTTRRGSTGWLIKSLGTWLDNQMDLQLKHLGLSRGQFAIIMTLLEGDGLTQAEIGRKISMPGYATTRNLDKLEITGLLVRQKHETSRRSHRINLTQKGKDLAPKLFAIVKDVNDTLLASFSDSEVNVLQKMLSQLVDERHKSSPNKS